MKKYRTLAVMLLAAAMCFAMFAGCGNSAAASASSSENSAPAEHTAVSAAETPAETETEPAPEQSAIEEPASAIEEIPSAEEAPAEEEKVYAVVEMPFTEDAETLSMVITAPNVPEGYGIESYGDFAIIQNLEAESNVSMEFNEITFASYETQFNLVCASGDYPDLLYGVYGYYPSGLTGAYSEDVIMPLNDYLDECAPDYLRRIEENGSITSLKNDDGLILDFRQIMDSMAQKSGCVVRKDWLDALGLEVPTTVDEMEEVLAAFLSEYHCEQPLYMTNENTGANIIYAYGIPVDGRDDCLYQNDGVVLDVYESQELRDFITEMNSWFNQGFFIRDYTAVAYDPFAQGEKVLLAEDNVGVWNANLNDLPGYDGVTEGLEIAPVGSLVLNEGDTLHCSGLGYTDQASVSISATCEHPELAAKWMNYWYTEEGSAAYNYGVEGETYEVVNGECTFTDIVSENDLGVTKNQYLRLYCLAGTIPGYQIQKRTACFYTDLQNEAWDLWTDSLGDSANIIPSNISLTAEESEEAATIGSDIYTYASECIPQFILGTKSMDEWDAFVADIQSMNISGLVEIYQDALDRYNAR